MSKRSLIFIILSVIILIAISKFNSKNNRQGSARLDNKLVTFDIDNVSKITISSKDEKVSLLKKDNDSWAVDSLFGYGANKTLINSLMLKIATLTSTQMVTSNKDNFSYLGLIEPDVISISLGNKEKTVCGILLGKERESKKSKASYLGRYAKSFGSNDVYLISNDINVLMKNSEWIDNSIIKVSKLALKNITVLTTKPQLQIFPQSINKENVDENEIKFELIGLNVGDSPKDWVVNQMLESILDLKTQSILPHNDESLNDIEFHELINLEVKNGSIYKFFGGELGETFYLKIELNLSEIALNKKNQDITNLISKLKSWVFVIESWNANNFKKKYEDLVEIPQKEDKLDSTDITKDEGLINDEVDVNVDTNNVDIPTVEPSF